MKFKKSKDFIDAINKVSKEGVDIQIDLQPKKRAFYDELIRWGEWNGKYFEISGYMYLKNAEIEWYEDLNYLINQLDGKEINQLGPKEVVLRDGTKDRVTGFDGFEDIGDDGGYPQPNEEGIKWFEDELREEEIQLTDKELKEFEEVGINTLWDEAGWENEDQTDRFMDDDGIIKIKVSIGDNIFCLINEEYFENYDDNGNWINN